MTVGINQAGHDRLSLQIDETGARTPVDSQFVHLPCGYDFSVLDGHGRRDRELRIHGDDPAILQNQVSRIGCRSTGKGSDQKSQQAHPHHSSRSFLRILPGRVASSLETRICRRNSKSL